MNSNSQRTLWVALIAVGIIAISGLWISVGHAPTEKPLGAVNGGNVTNFTAVQVSAGYWVGTTQVITSAGAVNAGALTASGQFQMDAGENHSYTNSTSTTATSQTLAASDVTNYQTVVMTPNVGSVTLTFPATSTLSAFVPNTGDWADQCWLNGTSTASKTITVVAGTGFDFEVASTTLSAAATIAQLPIGPGDSACFRFIRKPTSDIEAQFVRYVDGD